MIQSKPYHSVTKTPEPQNQIESDFDEAMMKELKSIYWHERQLMVAIPLLLSSATTFELVESLTLFSKYTRTHIKALEAQFPEIARNGHSY